VYVLIADDDAAIRDPPAALPSQQEDAHIRKPVAWSELPRKDQLVIILLGSAAVSFALAFLEDEGGWSAFVDPAVVRIHNHFLPACFRSHR